MAAPTLASGVRVPVWDKTARVFLCLLGVFFSLLALRIPHDTAEEEGGGRAAAARCASAAECGAETRWRRGCGLVELLLGERQILTLPNSILGLLFYLMQLLLGLTSSATAAVLLFATSICSALGSAYLATSLLAAGLLRAVCGAVYAVNLLLLGLNYKRLVFLNAAWTTQQQQQQRHSKSL
ncbi:unnamed protein product [Lampetra fluviatilis]